MKVLLASSEVYPYSKTGGLADMVGAMGKALAHDGHETTIITPFYGSIREKHKKIEPTGQILNLPLGDRRVEATIWKTEPVKNLTIYFVEQPEFYNRPSLYQENGVDYDDNAERFIFFSKAVVELARTLPTPPEIVHVHDWQAGLVPLFIKHQELTTGWRNAPASCLTIHNLAFQGVFPRSDYPVTNLPWDYFTPDGVEFYNYWNSLKAAIVYSDMITTVSPRYAREITTEQYGCGLDGVLRNRQKDLVGILNGVDYTEWNTVKNPFLKFTFSPDDLDGKKSQKAALQEEFGLPREPDIPLFGTVSRLADQKGVDIQIAALEEMLSAPMQFVCLGSGDPEFEKAFLRLAERFPKKAAVRIGYDHALAHRIEAGCDFFLMPSRFEPCGLNQMYSLRYGTIPIVRVTGGLDDSVTDVSEDIDKADGIKFYEYSARALTKAIRKALVLYENPALLEHYRQNGMRADFSWEQTTGEYVDVYRRALERRGRRVTTPTQSKEPLGV